MIPRYLSLIKNNRNIMQIVWLVIPGVGPGYRWAGPWPGVGVLQQRRASVAGCCRQAVMQGRSSTVARAGCLLLSVEGLARCAARTTVQRNFISASLPYRRSSWQQPPGYPVVHVGFSDPRPAPFGPLQYARPICIL